MASNSPPPLVQGGTVQFGEATPIPSTVPEEKSSLTSTFDLHQSKALMKAAQGFRSLADILHKSAPSFPPSQEFQGLDLVIALGIRMEYRREIAGGKISHNVSVVSAIPRATYVDALQQTYGNYILGTDLVQGLPESVPVKDIPLPEFEALQRIPRFNIQSHNLTTSNPYSLLFMVDPQYRPFLAGAFTTAEEAGEFKALGDWAEPMGAINIGLIKNRVSTKSLLAYAEKKQEKNVRTYLELLKTLPRIVE